MKTHIVWGAWLLALQGAAIVAAQAPPQRSGEQLQAIAAIRAAGGQVLEIAQNDPRLDVAFHLASEEITDEDLQPLRHLSDVVHLNLRGTQITDDGLQYIAHLDQLARLHLERTAIGDQGLRHLAKLTSLTYLNLYGTKVTDAGLKHLEGLKNLRRLYLWQTEVSDAGVAALKKALPELEIIRAVDLRPADTAAPSGQASP
jgi:hypothetical protein